jgi:hypothetical protein
MRKINVTSALRFEVCSHKNFIIMASVTKTSSVKWLLLFGLIVFFSCQKERQQENSPVFNASNSENDNSYKHSETKKIYVSDVEQLYAVVNDPSNAGSRIVLAPGTYLLTAGHPHGGRIELGHDMSLAGQQGHPEEVIIDVSGLPASSLQLPPSPPSFDATNRTGTIRMGDGSNAIEWMTLLNDPSHRIRTIINTDLNTTPVTYVRIAHTIVKGSSIGINIQNRELEANGRTINAEIEDNEITGNIILPFATGIQIQNSWGIAGAAIRVTLRGNYVHGNQYGLAAFNESSINSAIEINSNADRFEDNALGIALIGGRGNGIKSFDLTNGNSVLLEAHGTVVRNNPGTPKPPGPPFGYGALGGISAQGGFIAASSKPGYVNDNRLEINLWGCLVENNVGPFQINAYGARSLFPSTIPAGSNNTTTIHLNGLSKEATVNAIPSLPAEPAGTNVVYIFQ